MKEQVDVIKVRGNIFQPLRKSSYCVLHEELVIHDTAVLLAEISDKIVIFHKFKAGMFS